MTIKSLLYAFLLLILFTACSPLHLKSGQSFTMSQIESIEKGKTTREEIMGKFGIPRMTGKDNDSNDTWTYLFFEAEVPLKGEIKKERYQRISITFDNGHVKAVSYEVSGIEP